MATRSRFPPSSVLLLNSSFAVDPAPPKEHRLHLAAATGATERQIRIWFQNKRQRLRVRQAQQQQEQQSQSQLYPPHLQLTHQPGCPAGEPQPGAAAAGGGGSGRQQMAIFTSPEPPFRVMWASEAWMEVCGFTCDDEVVGKTLKIIQGPLTEPESLAEFHAAIERKTSTTVALTNYDTAGRPFRHKVAVLPLTNSRGEVCIYKAESSDVHFLSAPFPFGAPDGGGGGGRAEATDGGKRKREAPEAPEAEAPGPSADRRLLAPTADQMSISIEEALGAEELFGA